AEDGIRDPLVTGVQTCALPILGVPAPAVEEIHAAGVRGGGELAEDRRVEAAVGGRAERADRSVPVGGGVFHAAHEVVREGLDGRSEERRVGKECGWRW